MTTPQRILVLLAHPALEKSRVNVLLAEAIAGVEGITLHDLYEAYPELDVGVKREQALLVAHDVVVMQHPFFWYSVPPILKEWMDLVLEHGWAYGSKGKALRGKRLLSAITTGGRAAAYTADGYNRYTMAEFLRPIEQTARLCGMAYLPPFVVHGTHGMAHAQMLAHAQAYKKRLLALRDGAERGRSDAG